MTCKRVRIVRPMVSWVCHGFAASTNAGLRQLLTSPIHEKHVAQHVAPRLRHFAISSSTLTSLPRRVAIVPSTLTGGPRIAAVVSSDLTGGRRLAAVVSSDLTGGRRLAAVVSSDLVGGSRRAEQAGKARWNNCSCAAESLCSNVARHGKAFSCGVRGATSSLGH